MDHNVETAIWINRNNDELTKCSGTGLSRSIIPNDWQITKLFAETMLLVRPQIVSPDKFVNPIECLERLSGNKPFHSIIITSSEQIEYEFRANGISYFSINDQQHNRMIASQIKAFTSFLPAKYAVLLVQIIREHNTNRLCDHVFGTVNAGIIKYFRNDRFEQINDATVKWINKRSSPVDRFYLEFLWQYEDCMEDMAFRYFCGKMGVTPKHFNENSIWHGPAAAGFTQKNLQNFDPLRSLMKAITMVNPTENVWNRNESDATISSEGLRASLGNLGELQTRYIFASKGFPIVQQYGFNNPHGIKSCYFEVKRISSKRPFYIGLSSPSVPSIRYGFWSREEFCYLAGKKIVFEWTDEALKPKTNYRGMVTGCGILMSGTKQMAIFFTVHGTLMGKPISIIHPNDLLFPTIRMFGNMSLEANFGDEPAKPFLFDLVKCPALKLE